MKDLIARLEAATDGSRELDLAIQIALCPEGDVANAVRNYHHGFDHKRGYSWEWCGSDQIFCFKFVDAHGQCTYNGSYPLPHYTTSLDSALTLVPEGWTRVVDASAPECGVDVVLYAPGADPRKVKGTHNKEPIATIIAALKARESQP